MNEPIIKRLHSTTDAKVWAQEWCAAAREIEANESGQVIDEGWMIGWFANAIETAKMAQAKASVVERDRLRGAIRAALDELGVPGPGYPAPVSNAVGILREAVDA